MHNRLNNFFTVFVMGVIKIPITLVEIYDYISQTIFNNTMLYRYACCCQCMP
jgi:hypothetical protein